MLEQHNQAKVLAHQILRFLKQRSTSAETAGGKNATASAKVTYEEIFQHLDSYRQQHTTKHIAYQKTEIFDGINMLLEQERIEVTMDEESGMGDYLYSYIDSKSAARLQSMDFIEK